MSLANSETEFTVTVDAAKATPGVYTLVMEAYDANYETETLFTADVHLTIIAGDEVEVAAAPEAGKV